MAARDGYLNRWQVKMMLTYLQRKSSSKASIFYNLRCFVTAVVIGKSRGS